MALRPDTTLTPTAPVPTVDLSQLPRSRGFLGMLVHGSGLRPWVPQDRPQIDALKQSILSGTYTPDQIKQLAQQNPYAVDEISSTLSMARQRQQMNQTLGQFFKDPANPDYMGAAAAAIQMGRPDLADAYSKEYHARQSEIQSQQNASREERALQEKMRHDRVTEGIFGGQGAQAPSSVHGDDFLKTLNPQVANMVKALAEGRMQFPGGFALKSPYWQNLLQKVGQYDPNFDYVNYNARANTRKDFSSGQSAKNVTSLNTVIGHLDSLAKATDKLNNSNIPLLNSISNFAASNTGDPRIKQFNAAKEAVVSELVRAFRGAGGAEADIQRWGKALDAADSPQQLYGVIQQMQDLLFSRISALSDQYNRGMGTTESGLNLLSPKSQKIWQDLEKKTGRSYFDNGQAAVQPSGIPSGWSVREK